MNNSFYFIVMIIFTLTFSFVVSKSHTPSNSDNSQVSLVQIYNRLDTLEESSRNKDKVIERLAILTKQNAEVLHATATVIIRTNDLLVSRDIGKEK